MWSNHVIKLWSNQVFDHHYHFDHLLDTAYEVEGHAFHFSAGGQSPEAASPLSSQGDLTELGGGEQRVEGG